MKLLKTSINSLILSIYITGFTVHAEAYIPKDDAEILEHLPVAVIEGRQLQQLKADVNSNPEEIKLALELAGDYIATGRKHSDPRYYSYAEAVLSPWVTKLQGSASNPEALALMATILQNRHDFKAALDLLNTALANNPRHMQAWLIKAAIHEAQGDYPSTLHSCLSLAKLSASFSATVCIDSALSLSGQAQYAYDQLTQALLENQASPEQLAWACTILAEMAERLNKPENAERWYRKALATGYRNNYLLMAYADFLLSNNRPDAARTLLLNETVNDSLLLRLALAEQRLRHPDFVRHAEIIKDRIAAAKARGDNVHQGDTARFTLQVLNDAETALKLASANWDVQKEPRDARLLLEAAIAANKPEAAQPILDFIEKSRLEDSRLLPLVKSITGT